MIARRAPCAGVARDETAVAPHETSGASRPSVWRAVRAEGILGAGLVGTVGLELSRVSPIVLRWAQLMGVGLDELCLAAQLDAEGIDRGVTHAEGMRLWLALEQITGDGCVGLTAGARATIDFMGPLGVMFSTAQDLGDALRVLGRALPILLQHGDVRVEISKRGGEVWYRSPNASPRHGIDSMFAAILALARQCSQHRVVPLAVQLQFAAPQAAAPYVRFYDVPPAFSQDACVMRFAVRDLERRFRGSDPRTNDLLLSHTSELVGPPAELPLAKIERSIEHAIAQGDGSLSSVAELLRVSARTLQRRLAEEGATFDALRSRLRYESALAQLGRGVPVSRVATALGYGSRTAFSRAFHRWTGTSPTAYAAGLGTGDSDEPT